jgi:hypothetical protein
MRWSYSAHNCFNRCKRQYYYSHIAAHHNAKKDYLRKEAHYLKQLTLSTFWSGKLVEAAIEDVFINDYPKTTNITKELYDYSMRLSEAQMKFSISNQFRSVAKSKTGRKYFRLFEHEYNMDDSGLLESTLDDVAICFQNYPLMIIPELGMSLSDLLALSNIKKCQIPVPLSMFDTPIQCYLDCLILFESKVIIIDWKVSKTTASNFAKQLKNYGLAVSRSTWGADKCLSDIYVYEANFYNGQITHYMLDEEDIFEIEDFIFDSIRRMEELRGGKEYVEIDIEDFPMCENLRVCQYCNFQKLCFE